MACQHGVESVIHISAHVLSGVVVSRWRHQDGKKSGSECELVSRHVMPESCYRLPDYLQGVMAEEFQSSGTLVRIRSLTA